MVAKRSGLLAILVILSLSGCVVVPAGPGAYVAGPPVVVAPAHYYGYGHGYWRHDRD